MSMENPATAQYKLNSQLYLIIFRLHLDINECSSKSLNNCQHICLNEMGSYKCACNRGYRLLADNESCQGFFYSFDDVLLRLGDTP